VIARNAIAKIALKANVLVTNANVKNAVVAKGNCKKGR
jgi:hypothetical protein